VDVWKENMLEDLESGNLEYKTAEKFLADLKKEFGGGNKEVVKVVEFSKLEQGGRTMEEFVQESRKAARGSRYGGRPLVEKFKKGMSRVIRRKLIEAERPPTNIKQWYKYATNLDRHWRESKNQGQKQGETKKGLDHDFSLSRYDQGNKRYNRHQ